MNGFMAHISAKIRANSLGFSTPIEMVFPQNTNPQKVLYLLHGMGDDSSTWIRNTRIESYATKHNYVVIMPEVQRSFYTDMVYGSSYFTYVTQELPQICEALFNIKHERTTTFVAGLSMGGYGALKCGLSRPDFYEACASFSGAVDPPALLPRIQQDSANLKNLTAILGPDFHFPDDANLFRLSEKVAALPPQEKPSVLVTCGDADFLLEDNRRFDIHMKNQDIPYKYMEWSGEHTWDFWEECLPIAFNFFETK